METRGPTAQFQRLAAEHRIKRAFGVLQEWECSCRVGRFHEETRLLSSALDHIIRKFIPISFVPWKVSGEHASDLLNRFDQRITEFLIAKMRSHFFNETLPEFIAAFLMDGVVSGDRKFMNPRRDKDKHGIAVLGLVHAELMKLLLSRDQRIAL